MKMILYHGTDALLRGGILLSEKYIYHGIDITLDVYEKIKSVVELIAKKKNVSFEDAYLAFAESPVYEALQNTETVLWYESPEYIVDQYCRKSVHSF